MIYQTVGFLKRRKILMHYLMGCLPEYNPHQVDYSLSRLREPPWAVPADSFPLALRPRLLPFR